MSIQRYPRQARRLEKPEKRTRGQERERQSEWGQRSGVQRAGWTMREVKDADANEEMMIWDVGLVW